MKKETFPGYQLITYDDGTYGYVMADGKSKSGYKSKDGAKKAAKKLATALQVTPYTITDIEQALADELSALYDDAAKYLVDKAKNFVSKYQTGEQYDADALNALIKQLTAQIAKTNADAVAAINGYAPLVAAEQANFTEYAIEDGTTLNPSFTLLNQDTVLRLIKDSPAVLPKAKAKIAKNKQWNTPKLRSALTHAIVQGDSIPKLSKKVDEICGSNKAIATRNARTMMTGARNAGTLAAYVRAEQNGMHIQKQWMAALDERTRVSHRHLDGEIKPVNEKFSNGLMHPGDTEGRPAEVYNCRCTMVPIVNDQLYEGERASKLKDMSYEEWRNAQPKPKSKAKKKKKNAGKDAKSNTTNTPKNETTVASENKVTEMPKNKEDLINALDAARNAAAADPTKIIEYREAVRELSENVPFGEFFASQIGEKHAIKIEQILGNASKNYHELSEMYKSWQSQFAFEDESRGAFYRSEDRKVHMNLSDVSRKSYVYTEYQAVFHELAHLIDNKSVSPIAGNKNISSRLIHYIQSDWSSYRDDVILEEAGCSHAENLTKDERNKIAIERLREKLSENYPTLIDGLKANALEWGDASDVIEGCTSIDYPLGAGHGAAYHFVEGHTAAEFFAEVCSSAIANEKSFARLKTIFPNAVNEVFYIVKELAG